ncbi:MAG TPA: hypothetical protein VEQ65_06575 [Opitutus sp.]|nr:hypothetical protein [Opitutus sp.]
MSATTTASERNSDRAPTFAPAQWRQVGVITLAAIGLYAFLRWLPTGTNLSHMDFRVDAKNAIDFCDPSNPQFIPVVAVASPVTMKLTAVNAAAGQLVDAQVVLATASGKPIATEDLLVVHTRPLHLLIVDESLQDYQHVHPNPTGRPGEWAFEFTPKAAGLYRVFADFTPAATQRGLYALADLTVASGPRAENPVAAPADYRFELTPKAGALRAGQVIDLQFTISHTAGAAVPLEPVMDAFAHLVAIDEARSGFAHLHPAELDLSKKPDPHRPTLNFKITIPQAGRYVIWAQVNLGGRETFVPFWFDVAS